MSRLFILGIGLAFLSFDSLAAQTPAERVDDAMKKLTDKDAKVRISALKELSEIGLRRVKLTKPAIEPVTNMLDPSKEADAEVRRQAYMTLANIQPDEKTATKLTDLIKESWKAEMTTTMFPNTIALANALGSMGAKAKGAVPVLNEFVGQYNKLTQEDKNRLNPVINAIGTALGDINGG